MDRWKMQIPKWVMRDFLSLGAVMYPDAPLNRRENPEHVVIEDAMTTRLAAAGFRYNPGHTHTYLPDAGTDPNTTLEPMTKADLARDGEPLAMYKTILTDRTAVEVSGVDLSKWSGVHKVKDDYGWSAFEVVMSGWLQAAQRERNALRARVKELEARG
jgi:hypothetical protein